MDGNFVAATEHASGEYIWLCGQDDLFEPGAIAAVLKQLNLTPNIDFVYANYGQYPDNHNLPSKTKMLDIAADIDCPNYLDFISITGIENLPTFLPSFIIRKALWNSVPKENFLGTQYVQLGVFLELLPQMHLYIISDPLIRGRIPVDGWQERPERRLDIFSGNLEIIKKAHERKPSIFPSVQFLAYETKIKRWIAESYLQCLELTISIKPKIYARFQNIFSFTENLLLRLVRILNFRLLSHLIMRMLFR
jgi:hypothetical protein